MSNDKRIDTSLDGLKFVGINLTEKQYEDLRDLNMLITVNEHRQNIPVFNVLLVLKILGLLPAEMMGEVGNSKSDDDSNSDVYNSLQRKFGKTIE